MITKERLEELIEQSATIYSVDTSNKTILSFKICKNENDIKLTEKQYAFFKKCFETKAEAEWHAEFGRIERTESLELPTWEEFNKSEKLVRFIGKNGEKCKLEGYFNLNLQSGFIDVVENGSSQLSLSEYTKENYIFACRKCKELFLGGNK